MKAVAGGPVRWPGSRVRGWIPWLVVAVVGALLTAAAITVVLERLPMSIVDEHVHYDYALRIHGGTIPYRGLTYSDALLDEWACGVGHEAGAPWTCGDALVSVQTLPSGPYTTGYIHYPSYFVAADLFRRLVSGPLGLGDDPITALRLFSVIGLVAGIALSAVAGRVGGLRGAGLVAAALAPSASAVAFLLGVIVNPGAFAVACGALVAAAGLWWVTRGTGFWMLAVAACVAALEASTASLPGVGFGLAAAIAIAMRRRGQEVPGPWQPRIRHVVTLALVTVVPVIVWGQVIAARATVGNDALYGAYTPQGLRQVLAGALGELGPHLPWGGAARSYAAGKSLLAPSLGALSSSLGAWLAPLIGVGLLLVVLGVLRSRRGADGSDERIGGGVREDGRTVDGVPMETRALRVLAIAQLVVLVTFPPALRLSNTLVFGIDFGIVDRYALSLAPVIVVTTLAIVRRRVYSWTVAGLATGLLVATALATW